MGGGAGMGGDPEKDELKDLTPLARVVLCIGSVGLLGAMFTDSVAVIGRHLNFHMPGSVELVQAFVVVASSASIVAATMIGDHANVRVLTDRARGAVRWILSCFANASSALYFALLAAGSGWILWDLRAAAEHTELLQIPLFWLRLLWLACAVICCALFAWRALPRQGDKE